MTLHLFALLLPLLLLLLIALLVFRALRFGVPGPAVPPTGGPELDADAAAARLGQAIAFPTVSYRDRSRMDGEAFLALHGFLEQAFPRVHAALKKETVNRYSLLYTWEGSDPELPPVLLMAHQDVVPVAPETEEDWTCPPFAGQVAAGYVWGRGALDVKSGLTGLLEAAELLLSEGFRPRRTVFLAFGHDEEVGGQEGTGRIAALLAERGVRLAFVLDEGGAVTEGVLPGVAGPVAMVGIAEKGYVNVGLTARGEGGHASMPARRTVVGILAMALARVEANPFPADLSFLLLTLRRVADRLSFLWRLILANTWLFGPLVRRRIEASAKLNAGIRTTAAATMIHGGVQENVLPTEAGAVLNCRILPGDTVAGVTERLRQVVADPRVIVQVQGEGSDPSPVADAGSPAYRCLERSILAAAGLPGLRVAPFLVTGATDSRYFCGLADQVFRFLCNRLGPDDFRRIHGTDERICVANYAATIRFYYWLIRNSQEFEPSPVLRSDFRPL